MFHVQKIASRLHNVTLKSKIIHNNLIRASVNARRRYILKVRKYILINMSLVLEHFSIADQLCRWAPVGTVFCYNCFVVTCKINVYNLFQKNLIRIFFHSLFCLKKKKTNKHYKKFISRFSKLKSN